jgi:hypothetical protein
MPFIIGFNGYQKYTNPQLAKLSLANYWRQHNKMRNPEGIDNFCQKGYERLYNIQQGDVWGSIILDQIAPQAPRGTISRNHGFSFHEDVKYAKKSNFLKGFYQGGNKTQQ